MSVDDKKVTEAIIYTNDSIEIAFLNRLPLEPAFPFVSFRYWCETDEFYVKAKLAKSVKGFEALLTLCWGRIEWS
jgi:hypothetical protein